MDLNLLVLCGRLAAPAEMAADGRLRCLITVRQTEPARVDVIPVTQWDPDPQAAETILAAAPGERVWVAGSMQRRFHSGPDGRRSRLECVAEQICLRPAEGV